MAGHFILRNLVQSDLNTANNKGGTLSGRQHAPVGWRAASEAILTDALNGNTIPNRDALPPHVYLQFNATVAGDVTDTYLKACGWGDQLLRPTALGLGLRALTPEAEAAWQRGDKNQALALQANHGAISIEIYYQSGLKV